MNKPASSHRGSFVEIEHTADLAIEVTAESLGDLFALCAEALFSLIADPQTIQPLTEITISTTAADVEELLHAWLTELLAKFNLSGFVGRHCRIDRIGNDFVEGRIEGEALDLKRHNFYTEIKGVTYHDFRVWQEHDAWHARIVFDV